ncbi:DUF2501 domain-containing protein [Pseudoxanthomonas winnipegensis]|uniref:DUF2501 domain-containing protein n=1 Tax=Pseudoxanthomonas winnipegensis TaxID=2480810 RepID=A0A4Q8LQT1_9GAMM|nr:DUF2501 domain-containing protein [Pseudoxanthomonas winnipegensis]RZZ89388.1 DUF2501 domain-containing protein [Pseudoxanthomonas winnipegensis]TAA33166.1 DUF2501 domain-containing protein [Pseudoxanthomonas winnipegensis]TAA44259.1 DUF2501 domain-containing protein [Pseudoxanthomonas winnipegensis]TBV78347.1 DUF2501 domain-containing protein [Pseudoxanthomonas winnipegensis]
MKTTSRSLKAALMLGALALAGAAQAQDFKQLLKQHTGQAAPAGGEAAGGLGALGGLSLPAIGGNTAGNAAGVLQYCVQRKYLSADAVTGVKDKLLSKYGLGGAQKPEQSPDYQRGLMGVLKGEGGQSFNLDAVSGKLKDKACDYVLNNATKLI